MRLLKYQYTDFENLQNLHSMPLVNDISVHSTTITEQHTSKYFEIFKGSQKHEADM